MNTITNRYADIEMWNVDSGTEKRGPFMIVQCGAAPGDDLMKEQMFLLRHDGKWVNVLGFDSAGQAEELDEMVFDTPRQCLQLLRQLQALAEVADAPATNERMRFRPARAAGADPLSSLYRLTEHYRHQCQERSANHQIAPPQALSSCEIRAPDQLAGLACAGA
jgi:hypothetical protein